MTPKLLRRIQSTFRPPLSGTVIAVDTETTGLDPYRGDRPFCYTFANEALQTTAVWEDHAVDVKTGRFTLPYADMDPGARRLMVRRWLADPGITKVFHNAKFDLKMLAAFGVQVRGPIHDTMIMAHLLGAHGKAGQDHEMGILTRLSLDTLARKYLDNKKVDTVKVWMHENSIRFRKTYGRNPNYSDVPKAIIEDYARHDAKLTMQLYGLMKDAIDKLQLRTLYDTEMQLVRTVIRMEDRGVRLDVPFMKLRIKELKEQENRSHAVLQRWLKPIKTVKIHRRKAGIVKRLIVVPTEQINLGSDKQLAQIVHGQLGLPISERTGTGSPKMDERTLSRIDHPFTKELVRWRQYGKCRGTYFEGYLERMIGNTLHPNYIQIGTHTGRFSSQNPNLQNIPMEDVVRERAGADVVYKGVKRSFIPRSGFTNFHFDYSQVELRMMAHFANDPGITAIMNSGRDIHSEVCTALFGQVTETKRVLAKIVTFGLLYGMGRKTFAWKLKVPMDKVEEILALYFETFPGIRDFQNRMIRQVRETGQVRNMLGRRYLIDQNFGYKSVNYVCQGSAADILKRSMVRIDQLLRKKRLRSAMLLTIHDEVVLEIHHSEQSWLPKKIVDIMVDVPECKLPLKVSVERAEGSWENLIKTSAV